MKSELPAAESSSKPESGRETRTVRPAGFITPAYCSHSVSFSVLTLVVGDRKIVHRGNPRGSFHGFCCVSTSALQFNWRSVDRTSRIEVLWFIFRVNIFETKADHTARACTCGFKCHCSSEPGLARCP